MKIYTIFDVIRLVRYFRILRTLKNLSGKPLTNSVKYYVWNQVLYKKSNTSAIITVVRDHMGW